ncbi:MAG: YgiQ family radical SAM protein [Bacteroidales bacterium]
MVSKNRGFLPTSKKELDLLGWDYIDIILFTGDAYIDHPSFGTAVIGRYLQSLGYRVAIVPQPNWRDDLRDFKKLGAPRLFFGVNSGVMDSMINHYTAAKRLRSNDAYTADGRAGQRPDYAVTVYSKILKKLYPTVPVIIGGVEASLRRLAHYDYWQDSLKPSILFESQADLLVYGMGERVVKEVASTLNKGGSLEDLKKIPQTAWLSNFPYQGEERAVKLISYEKVLKSREDFVKNFNVIEEESNAWAPAHISEPCMGKYVRVNPPFEIGPDGAIDQFYDLPYKREPHYRYLGKHISAFEMIKFSVTTHRGCFGSCSFCTISAHQGKFVQSRSEESILKELSMIAAHENFKGIISDLGGPTANMYKMKGKNLDICIKCHRDSCIYPNICKNLNYSHNPLLELYSKASKVKNIKKNFVSSGIRYDLFLNKKGYLDNSGKEYFKELILNHTSGRLKVAPEHTEESVLKAMGKPPFSNFTFLKNEFDKICKEEQKKFQLIPYFISSHPGCTLEHMKALASNKILKSVYLNQVQDFTPTPMTRSAAAFYSGLDPTTLKKMFVERDLNKKKKQKSLFFNKF